MKLILYKFSCHSNVFGKFYEISDMEMLERHFWLYLEKKENNKELQDPKRVEE